MSNNCAVNDMDFRQIEAFFHVARLKSFSKAGDALYLTQPTISAHITSLENELGVKLFDRSSKEVALTRAGEIFYDYAVNLINTRDMAVFSLRDYTRRIEGRLEIASSTIPANYLLPTVIKAFSQQHPNVKYSLVQMDSREVLERVLNREFEIGLAGSQPEGDKLDFRLWREDELVLIAPNGNNCFGVGSSGDISMQDIDREPFIMRESGSGTRREFEKALRSAGYDPARLKIIVQVNSTEAAIQAVRQGLGVSVVSSLSVSDTNKGLIRMFRIKGLELRRAFYIVTLKNRPLSPLVQVFKEFIAEYFKQ